MGVICCAPPELLDNSEQLTCLHTTACAVFARNEEGLPGIVAGKHCLAACMPGLPTTVKHSMLQRAIKDPSRTEVQAEVSWATTDVAYAGRICVCCTLLVSACIPLGTLPRGRIYLNTMWLSVCTR